MSLLCNISIPTAYQPSMQHPPCCPQIRLLCNSRILSAFCRHTSSFPINQNCSPLSPNQFSAVGQAPSLPNVTKQFSPILPVYPFPPPTSPVQCCKQFLYTILSALDQARGKLIYALPCVPEFHLLHGISKALSHAHQHFNSLCHEHHEPLIPSTRTCVPDCKTLCKSLWVTFHHREETQNGVLRCTALETLLPSSGMCSNICHFHSFRNQWITSFRTGNMHVTNQDPVLSVNSNLGMPPIALPSPAPFPHSLPPPPRFPPFLPFALHPSFLPSRSQMFSPASALYTSPWLLPINPPL
jgi:hypothetical protein